MVRVLICHIKGRGFKSRFSRILIMFILYLFFIIFLPLLNFFIFFPIYLKLQKFILISSLNKNFYLNNLNKNIICFYYLIYKFFNFPVLSILNIFYSFYLIIVLSIKMINFDILVFNYDFINWIECGIYICNFGLIFDRVTIVMLLVVLFISLIVHIYSIEYMSHDIFINKFFSYISFFTFFMLFLVTSNNLLQIFLGWEGVSLCSYLLINFWSNRIQANKSSMKAFIINRITDFFLIISFFLIIQHFKTFDLNSIFSISSFFKNKEIYFLIGYFNLIDIISFFFFLGSIGKSAQIFFHTWLPDAMEGPTPVSALIHSATMVTAGIFMVIRFSHIIEYSEVVLQFILFLGSFTALYSGIVALFQYDIKKIIAFSTCSQLGFMFAACGISNYNSGLFHLFNHSFFKALLFLSSGIIIHFMHDEQDIRKFGNLTKILPVIYIFFVIGGLALIGFPFLTGFYSKESIIELLIEKETISGVLSYWLLLLSTFFTSLYVSRLFFLVFFNKINSHKSVLLGLHKNIGCMVFSSIFLVIGSIFSGFLFQDFFLGVGSNFFDNSFFILPQHNQKMDNHFISENIKLLPIIFTFFGIIIIFMNYKLKFFFKILKKKKFFNFFNRKFYFDRFYNTFIIKVILNISFNKLYKIYDKYYFNFFGYNSFSIFFNNLGNILLKIEKNNILFYIFILYFFLLFFLIFGYSADIIEIHVPYESIELFKFNRMMEIYNLRGPNNYYYITFRIFLGFAAGEF